jgi:hypothetical protein
MAKVATASGFGRLEAPQESDKVDIVLLVGG